MKPSTVLFAVLSFVTFAASAQPERVEPEYQRAGLVVVAFAKDDAEANQAISKMAELTLGQPVRSVRQMQLDIVMKATKANPVVILVPDDEMKLRVLEDCDDVDGLCDYLDSGRVTVEVIPHEGPWVRDYGPMFRSTANGPVVLHAPYHDERVDVQKREELQQINGKRLELLSRLDPSRSVNRGLDLVLDRLRARHKEGGDAAADIDLPSPPPTDSDAAPETHSNDAPAAEVTASSAAAKSEHRDESTPAASDADTAAAVKRLEKLFAENDDDDNNELLEQLRYYDELYAAKEKENVQRQLDEEAAPRIGIALLANANVAAEKMPIDIDGGNLLPMPDGQCLTTRGLLERNTGRQAALKDALTTRYGCSNVVYLYPLAGGVIEHVDMFVLPAGDKRVFLASFNPATDVLKPYWASLNGGMARLAMESAIAMAENARILRDGGYTVIEVPAMFPREVPIGPGVFYPTVLNGLVQKGETGKLQFILPTYDDYEPEVQTAALSVIKSTLGDGVDVETVEATPAAIEQGAVHCLTLVVPQQWTAWGNTTSQSLRRQIYGDAQKITRSRSEGLEGVWHLRFPAGDKRADLFSSLDPKIVFRQQKLRFVYGTSKHAYDYRIVTKDADAWTLKVGDGTMKVVWRGPSTFDLIDDENHTITAVRK